ncbi:MAG: hypothetical protein Q9177_004526 [Variospora cf. flavescens]
MKDGYQTTKDVAVSRNVEIRPGPLADILRDSLNHYPNFPLHDTLMSFSAPFSCFVYNWTKLQAEADGDGDKQSTANNDLKQLLEHISATAELTPYFQDFHTAKDSTTINFRYLWTIFPPGCLIYSKPVMGEDQVLLLQLADDNKLEDSAKRGLILTCWAYDWNGETFNRVAYDLEIESFDDTKAINMLDHYCVEYHRDPKKVRSDLIERGKKYRYLCVPKNAIQLFDYGGINIED